MSKNESDKARTRVRKRKAERKHAERQAAIAQAAATKGRPKRRAIGAPAA